MCKGTISDIYNFIKYYYYKFDKIFDDYIMNYYYGEDVIIKYKKE